MQHDEALRAIAALERHQPTEWYDFMNLSSAFFVTGDIPRAAIYGRNALQLERNSSTLLNLGVILESQSKFEVALPLAKEAHQLSPNDPLVSCWYSDALMRLGKFSPAWPIYAHSHANYIWMRSVLSEWDGKQSLSDKRVLLLSGGGYGDNILHARWIPFLAALGARITFICPPTLHSLFAGQLGISRFLSGSIAGFEEGINLNEFDCFINLYSLITHFCPAVSDIPRKKYLSAGKVRQTSGSIGLCTRGGEKNSPRRHRTLSTEQADRLRTAARITFDFDNFAPDATWRDTASLIAKMSLVVTVDTGVAHLAGALGIETMVILPGISAAYYGTKGWDNHFYPSHRLFRNGSEGIDNSVNAVCAALERL